jgi:kinetochore protein Mis13/DSN1
MSFSTPNGKDEKPRRRSKRISNESVRDDLETRTEVEAAATANERPLTVSKRPRVLPRELIDKTDASLAKAVHHVAGGSSTTISLPFADTPVIRRNKEMRQGKAGKNGERRSSLGMRGRRASSLIESGNSNGRY